MSGSALFYKDDWDMAKKRTAAWYQREIIDRCMIEVRAPKSRPGGQAGVTQKPIKKPPTLDEQWTNIDYVLDAAEEYMRTTFFGGEAFPEFRPNLGPSFFTAVLGCRLKFREDTSWTAPIIHDWDTFDGLNFDRQNHWYQWMTRITKLGAQRFKGKAIVGITDIHGGGDGIASLRGTEEFLVDLLLHPDKIDECERFLRKMWFGVVEELHQLSTSEGQDGSSGFLGWGPGKTCPLQEDVLAMISPPMFKQFFLDAIIEQTHYLTCSMFHLDGPEALPHLHLLLDLPKLHGIQWQPGYAHSPILQWVPVIKRIQAKNKCVQIYIQPAEVEPILREVSARGLKLDVPCDTEAQARDLLNKVAQWTRD